MSPTTTASMSIYAYESFTFATVNCSNIKNSLYISINLIFIQFKN